MNAKNQNVLVFEHSWVWVLLDRWILVPFGVLALTVWLLLTSENRVEFLFPALVTILVVLIVLLTRASAKRMGKWVLDLGKNTLTDYEERDPWWMVVKRPDEVSLGSSDDVKQIESKWPNSFLRLLFNLGRIHVVTEAEGKEDTHEIDGIKAPELVSALLLRWKNDANPDEITKLYDGWLASKSSLQKVLVALWWLVTFPVTLYRFFSSRRRGSRVAATDRVHIERQPEKAALATEPEGEEIWVEPTKRFPNRSGPYRCAEPKCDVLLDHPLFPRSDGGYYGLAVWVGNGEPPSLALFCQRDHFLPYLVAAREGNSNALSNLRHVGRIFEGNAPLKFFKGEGEMSDTKTRGDAELAPEDEEPRGADLMPDKVERPLWQRPPVIIAAAVGLLILVSILFTIFSGGGSNADLASTIPVVTTTALVQTTDSAKVTRTLVPSTPVAKPLGTPAVKALIVPKLVSLTDCKGSVPKGTPVWQWLVDGSLIAVKDVKGGAVGLTQAVTLNGMGLVWQQKQYCFITMPESIFRFVQAAKKN